LGSGPGTATWAAAQTFSTLQEATLVEREGAMIAIGERLARAAGGALSRADWVRDDLVAFVPAQVHDLVVMAYSLGEIDPATRTWLIERAWKQTSLALVI